MRKGSPGPVADCYRQLDEEINQRLGVDIGFTALVRASAYETSPGVVEGFRSRYGLIRDFQERTLQLFKASLRGETDPEIARSVLGDAPEPLGPSYHRALTEPQHRVPTFFRTDEAAPGRLTEIQCPGSGWCMTEEIQTLYRRNEGLFGTPHHFRSGIASAFSASLRSHLGALPIVHHLSDNASRPHGARYFIQRTRGEGIKYFGYDRDIGPQDCNFIRSHDFITLPHHNFFAERMERCSRGELAFDLSPSALFDCKAILAWPFWSKTRASYGDEVRSLFPYTSLVGQDGIEMPDGASLSHEAFCRLPPRRRDVYFKYAGSDISLNWGSRAVFLARTLSAEQARKLMGKLAEDTRMGRFWILQEAVRHEEPATAFRRDGGLIEVAAYSKFSGLYGPHGLMGILVMQKPFHKVHGSIDTIMSVVN